MGRSLDADAMQVIRERFAELSLEQSREVARTVAAARRDPNLYLGIPAWIDTGTTDYFRRADTQFARELARGSSPVTYHVWPGGHGDAHWDGHFPDYIRFLADALARC